MGKGINLQPREQAFPGPSRLLFLLGGIVLAGAMVWFICLHPRVIMGDESATGKVLPLEDVVIIKGAELPAFIGKEISALNLIALSDNSARPIPFQVDEVRAGYHVFAWVSPLGKEQGLFTQDVDAGRLDADDELVFMAWDVGGRAVNKAQLGAPNAIELSITDPGSGKTGYVYLVMGGNAARSKVDYVQFKIAGDRLNINTERYQYSTLTQRGFFDHFRIRQADGAWTPNLVLRNQSPGQATLRGLGISADFDFYDLIRGENIAYKDGPVRVLWRCAGGADFGVLKIKAKGSTEEVYYGNSMDLPVTLDLPFSFDSFLQSFDISGTVILDPKALPLTYFDIAIPQGVRFDGKPDSGNGPLLGNKPRDWCAISAPGASFYYLVLFSPTWTPKLKRVSYLDDRPERSEAGTVIGDLVHLLNKGRHEYMVRYYALPVGFRWGGEKKIPEIAGRQLRVAAKTLP